MQTTKKHYYFLEYATMKNESFSSENANYGQNEPKLRSNLKIQQKYFFNV